MPEAVSIADEELQRWQQSHASHALVGEIGERKTRRVVVLTAVMMVIEIAAGVIYGSMALLADGWHMASHAAALGITLFAYAYARRHADSRRYAFGTGKVNALGGFASAMVLGVIAVLVGFESLHRFVTPVGIDFDEALVVAGVGLLVNAVSVWMLWTPEAGHDHGHAHAHAHGHAHAHVDHNLRAAYMHVVADLLTSVLAIVALAGAKYLGWQWLDPAIGLVGAGLILRWSVGLVRLTSHELLDGELPSKLARDVASALEAEPNTRVADLHLWRAGPGYVVAIASIVTTEPRAPEYYKGLLRDLPAFAHITIEVNRCGVPSMDSEP